MNYFKLLFFIGFFISLKASFGQVEKSVYDSIPLIKNDSLKVKYIIDKIIEPLIDNSKFENAAIEINNARKYIKNENDFRLKNKFVAILIKQENYEEAKEIISQYEQEAIKLKNNIQHGQCLRHRAEIELNSGNLDKSSIYYFKALDKFILSKNSRNIALSYSDIGVISFYNENYNQAIYYWNKSILLDKLNNNKKSMANNLSNISLAYIELKDYKNAESSLFSSIKLCDEINDRLVKANAYTNLTKLEFQNKNYKKAIEYNNKAAEYFESVKKYNLLANAYSNGAELARNVKDYKLALTLIDKAFKILDLTDNKNNFNNFNLNKAAILYDLKSYQQAYDELYLYSSIKDSIESVESQTNINELEKKYQLKERQRENTILSEKIKSQELYTSKMQITIGLISLIVLILGITAFVFIKQNRAKSIINLQLSEKNSIINLQKSIVEDQHRDIKDSIKYAKRIQEAILPPLNLWHKILPSSFILHIPKDELSGDFYWIEENENYIFVAAADCTGHGVPGALISIVNFNLLNKAVLEKNIENPSEILDAVNNWLTESLHQTYGESAVKDGMDITLIAINKKTNEVHFAGANNPIYKVTNGVLTQIKGDKFPVGAFIEDKINKFTLHKFTVEKGDNIYLFSDGFADQFGGPKGKKYKYYQFQQKLISLSNNLPQIQQESLKKEFHDWQGSHDQVDDVLVIGIKIA
ncbi:MAG: SpoIIE family protein phosphatase [Bacteroidetes bacterium]|nr:SpoIIE family protein phosphatase [Bacteroidota bacterium]